MGHLAVKALRSHTTSYSQSRGGAHCQAIKAYIGSHGIQPRN
jgi:hypothetical protein